MNRRKKAEDLITALDRLFKYHNVYIDVDYNQQINIYDYDENKILIENLEVDKDGSTAMFVTEMREMISSRGGDDEN